MLNALFAGLAEEAKEISDASKRQRRR